MINDKKPNAFFGGDNDSDIPITRKPPEGGPYKDTYDEIEALGYKPKAAKPKKN